MPISGRYVECCLEFYSFLVLWSSVLQSMDNRQHFRPIKPLQHVQQSGHSDQFRGIEISAGEFRPCSNRLVPGVFMFRSVFTLSCPLSCFQNEPLRFFHKYKMLPPQARKCYIASILRFTCIPDLVILCTGLLYQLTLQHPYVLLGTATKHCL